MAGTPILNQRLTLYFKLDDSVAKPAPEMGFRCSNTACEQHARHYDLVPFQSCPTCYAPPETFETSNTVQAFPDLDDFLASIEDDIDSEDPFVVSGMTGVPGNIWIYNRDLDWLEEWCDGFKPDHAGVLCLDRLLVNSVVTRAFMGDIDIEAFMDRFQDVYGKKTISLHFGLIQYWTS